MSTLEKNLIAKKLSEARFRRDQREGKKAELPNLIEEHGLQFTYIREHDFEGEPNALGGAVICWQPLEKPNHIMLRVSIAWCRDDEPFDKVLGRYEAAIQYIDGHTTFFKLPKGPEGISAKLKLIFSSGFNPQAELSPTSVEIEEENLVSHT